MFRQKVSIISSLREKDILYVPDKLKSEHDFVLQVLEYDYYSDGFGRVYS